MSTCLPLPLLCLLAVLAAIAVSHDPDEAERCRGLEYDLTTELCCGGELYSLRRYDSCCGDKPYKFAAFPPAISGCCNGVPYSLYDQYCCREKTLYSIQDPDANDCMPV
ncbi:hypothetical protein NP493_106g06006 [Ridgeia piscesae]|uniref:Uncharacterized protein n=1 Tax=Ridgeia piscesae TaxID=27915 RepID=A0AAD9P787_RIDPI|nr:hypothetical protein NP493_106g06006 [Ridgeia piscesae]